MHNFNLHLRGDLRTALRIAHRGRLASDDLDIEPIDDDPVSVGSFHPLPCFITAEVAEERFLIESAVAA